MQVTSNGNLESRLCGTLPGLWVANVCIRASTEKAKQDAEDLAQAFFVRLLRLHSIV